jgi:hypothetical protein
MPIATAPTATAAAVPAEAIARTVARRRRYRRCAVRASPSGIWAGTASASLHPSRACPAGRATCPGGAIRPWPGAPGSAAGTPPGYRLSRATCGTPAPGRPATGLHLPPFRRLAVSRYAVAARRARRENVPAQPPVVVQLASWPPSLSAVNTTGRTERLSGTFKIGGTQLGEVEAHEPAGEAGAVAGGLGYAAEALGLEHGCGADVGE